MWNITNKRTGATESYSTRREAEAAARKHLSNPIMIDGNIQRNTDTYELREGDKLRSRMSNR